MIRKTKLAYLLLLFFIVIALVPLYYGVTNLVSTDFCLYSIKDSDLALAINEEHSQYQVVAFIKHHVKKSASILVFQQAHVAAYTHNRFISNMDPMILNVYQATSVKQAYQRLLAHNIHYIYIPYYAMPTLFNSEIGKLIADPNYTQVLFQSGFSRLFKLKKIPAMPKVTPVRINNSTLTSHDNQFPEHWTLITNMPSFGKLTWQPLATGHGIKVTNIPSLINYRGASYLYSGSGSIRKAAVNKTSYQLKPLSLYHLSAKIEGSGLIKISVYEYAKNILVNRLPVWQGVIHHHSNMIATQFITNSGVDSYRIVVSLVGPGDYRLHSMTMQNLELAKNSFIARQRKLESEGWAITRDTYRQQLNNIYYRYAQYEDGQTYKLWEPIGPYNNLGIYFHKWNHNNYNIFSPTVKINDKDKIYHFTFKAKGFGELKAAVFFYSGLITAKPVFLKVFTLSNKDKAYNLTIKRETLPVLLKFHNYYTKVSAFRIVFSISAPRGNFPYVYLENYHLKIT